MFSNSGKEEPVWMYENEVKADALKDPMDFMEAYQLYQNTIDFYTKLKDLDSLQRVQNKLVGFLKRAIRLCNTYKLQNIKDQNNTMADKYGNMLELFSEQLQIAEYSNLTQEELDELTADELKAKERENLIFNEIKKAKNDWNNWLEYLKPVEVNETKGNQIIAGRLELKEKAATVAGSTAKKFPADANLRDKEKKQRAVNEFKQQENLVEEQNAVVKENTTTAGRIIGFFNSITKFPVFLMSLFTSRSSSEQSKIATADLEKSVTALRNIGSSVSTKTNNVVPEHSTASTEHTVSSSLFILGKV